MVDTCLPWHTSRMETSQLSIEWIPVTQLFCSPSNPRINDHAIPHVADSIRRFGWRQPIVAKRSGEVIAGNTRLKAAQDLGHTDVPVHWFEGSDLDATAFAIADNRTHEFAEWNEPELARLLDHLRAEDSLEGVGYTDGEIDELLAQLEDELDDGTVEDDGPEDPPKTPVSRRGDLWVLGHHRLLCGDSSNEDDIDRLLGKDRPGLMATDPPYCVDYTGKDRPENRGKDWSDAYREIEITDFGEFLRSIFRAVLPRLRDEAGIYVWHAHLQYPVMASVFDEFDLLCHQPIIWRKPTSTFTYSFYRWQHEPCLFGWKRGNKPPHLLENGLSSVWEVDWDGKKRIVGNEHPTEKPTRLFEIPMEQHTKPGAVVFEPFSGSGSQLIAAEKLRRKCRAMEISPPFVDVAVKRWQTATGKAATLDGSGATFAEVEAQRERDGADSG